MIRYWELFLIILWPVGLSLAIVALFALAGCAGDVPPPSRLTPPDAALLQSPPDLPPLKNGDLASVTYHAIEVRKLCAAEGDKLEALQTYVRTVVGAP